MLTKYKGKYIGGVVIPVNRFGSQGDRMSA